MTREAGPGFGAERRLLKSDMETLPNRGAGGDFHIERQIDERNGAAADLYLEQKPGPAALLLPLAPFVRHRVGEIAKLFVEFARRAARAVEVIRFPPERAGRKRAD